MWWLQLQFMDSVFLGMRIIYFSHSFKLCCIAILFGLRTKGLSVDTTLKLDGCNRQGWKQLSLWFLHRCIVVTLRNSYAVLKTSVCFVRRIFPSQRWSMTLHILKKTMLLQSRLNNMTMYLSTLQFVTVYSFSIGIGDGLLCCFVIRCIKRLSSF